MNAASQSPGHMSGVKNNATAHNLAFFNGYPFSGSVIKKYLDCIRSQFSLRNSSSEWDGPYYSFKRTISSVMTRQFLKIRPDFDRSGTMEESATELNSNVTARRHYLELSDIELLVFLASINNFKRNLQRIFACSQSSNIDNVASEVPLSTESDENKDDEDADSAISCCSSINMARESVPQSTSVLDYKCALKALLKMYSWLTRSCSVLIRQGFANAFSSTNHVCKSCSKTQKLVEEITAHVDQIERNNGYETMELNDKFRSLSEELFQMRLSNESQIGDLNTKLQTAFTDNDKLTEDNNALRTELRALKDLVQNIKNNPPQVVITNCLPPRPPPPPPPPPPFPTSLDNTAKPKFLSNKTKGINNNTPKRPTITVEDLKNIKLKKTPIEPRTPKKDADNGLKISPDLLRSVKLRPTDSLVAAEIRSPRSPSR